MLVLIGQREREPVQSALSKCLVQQVFLKIRLGWSCPDWNAHVAVGGQTNDMSHQPCGLFITSMEGLALAGCQGSFGSSGSQCTGQHDWSKSCEEKDSTNSSFRAKEHPAFFLSILNIKTEIRYQCVMGYISILFPISVARDKLDFLLAFPNTQVKTSFTELKVRLKSKVPPKILLMIVWEADSQTWNRLQQLPCLTRLHAEHCIAYVAICSWVVVCRCLC